MEPIYSVYLIGFCTGIAVTIGGFLINGAINSIVNDKRRWLDGAETRAFNRLHGKNKKKFVDASSEEA